MVQDSVGEQSGIGLVKTKKGGTGQGRVGWFKAGQGR